MSATAGGDAGARASSLSAHGLACQRGGRVVVSGLDFTLRPGDIAWIRGANGSGKTTLLRTLAGLAAPATGRVAGLAEASAGAGIVYLAHANALNGDLSAAEALRFLLRLDDLRPGADAIDNALARLGIAHRRHVPVRALSQGQRRRVALARLAALPAAALWLLDEPFDALDAAGAGLLMSLLVEHAERGGIAILASHVPLPPAGKRPVEIDLDTLPRP